MSAKSGEFNRSMLIVVLFSFFIIVGLSFVPIAKYLLYPFKLFATFIHEMCHGLAAIFTGGKWIRFTVGADGSGLAWTSGGLRTLIIPAGYLGTSLLGGLLLFLSGRKSNNANIILFVMGVIMAAITLIFARNSTAIIVGLGFGVALGVIGMASKGFFPAFLLNFLAVNLSLNALLDVKTLFFHTTGGYGRNDAVAMNYEILGIGNITWAVLFVLFSVIITWVFLKKALKKNAVQSL